MSHLAWTDCSGGPCGPGCAISRGAQHGVHLRLPSWDLASLHKSHSQDTVQSPCSTIPRWSLLAHHICASLLPQRHSIPAFLPRLLIQSLSTPPCLFISLQSPLALYPVRAILLGKSDITPIFLGTCSIALWEGCLAILKKWGDGGSAIWSAVQVMRGFQSLTEEETWEILAAKI